MKIVILGAAANMAQPAIKYLIKQEVAKQIVLTDLDLKKVEQIAEQLGSNVIAKKLDVNDETELENTIEDANLLMNFIGPYFRFGIKALKAAINCNVNYLDLCDDFDVTEEALKLDNLAKEKGLTAITGMGASPGMTNVLARLGADALDQAEEINTYWIVGDAEPSGFGALIHMFHIMEGKVPTFMDGKQKLIRSFQNDTGEKIDFGGPVGTVKLYHVGHPEPVTLPRVIPGLKKVTNLGALLPEFQNPMFKTLVDLGFTSEEPILFQNKPVAPIEFLLALFHHKQEKTKKHSEKKHKSVSAARIEVIGKKEGQTASYTFTKSAFDSMDNGTSIPAGVVASLLLKGKIDLKGVIPPESLHPKEIISELLDTNYFEGEKDFEIKKVINEEIEVGSIQNINRFKEFR